MKPSALPRGYTRHYTVRPNETLTGIANRIYGSQASWWYIYQANKNQIDRRHGVIYTGETFIIPPVPGSMYTGTQPMPSSSMMPMPSSSMMPMPSSSMMPSAMPSSSMMP
jgi:hypothetical protein